MDSAERALSLLLSVIYKGLTARSVCLVTPGIARIADVRIRPLQPGLSTPPDFVAQAPVICQPAEIEHRASALKNTSEFCLLWEVLEDFMFGPVPQSAHLVWFSVGVFSRDWETIALDVAIVREYYQGSWPQLGVEHIEK